MQVVKELESRRGADQYVCGAKPVATARGWKIGLVLRYQDNAPVLKAVVGAPYRQTIDEAMADLANVAWGREAPVYEEVLAAA